MGKSMRKSIKLAPFYVGQKVVCVNDSTFDVDNELLPKKGVVYTIRNITFDGVSWGVQLNEIKNEKRTYKEGFEECYFYANRFSPLTESPFPSLTFKEVITQEKKLTCLN